jgi:hypothetical protein
VSQFAIEPIDYTTIFRDGRGQSGQRRWTISDALAPSYAAIARFAQPADCRVPLPCQEHGSHDVLDRGAHLEGSHASALLRSRASGD